VDFGSVSFATLTSFFAFEMYAEEDGVSATVSFLVNAALVGAPRDRRERLLVDLLSSRADVLRFLLFLLGGEPDDQRRVEMGADLIAQLGQSTDDAPGALAWQNLFEPMVRALANDPKQLDAMASFISDLEKTDQGRAKLPDDWDVVWKPIWAARTGLLSE